MLKRITKLCLATAAVALFAGQVSAADVKSAVNGRAIGYFQSLSEKVDPDENGSHKSVSKNDFQSSARLGAKFSATEGDITVGGYVQIDAGAMSTRDTYAFINTKSVAVELGRMYRAGITKGGSYLQDVTSVGQYYIGEMAEPKGGFRMDSVYVNLTDLGLYTQIGMNQVEGVNYGAAYEDKGEATESFYLVGYGQDFGSLSIAAQYSTSDTTVEKKRLTTANQTALDDVDGTTGSEMAASASYKISDGMTVALGVSNSSTKTGAAGAKTLATTVIQGSLDLGLDATSGISVFAAVKSADTESGTTKKAVTYNKIVAGYTKTIAGLRLFANVGNEQGKESAVNVDVATTEIAAGLRYNF